jgi:hypothetical protein
MIYHVRLLPLKPRGAGKRQNRGPFGRGQGLKSDRLWRFVTRLGKPRCEESCELDMLHHRVTGAARQRRIFRDVVRNVAGVAFKEQHWLGVVEIKSDMYHFTLLLVLTLAI